MTNDFNVCVSIEKHTEVRNKKIDIIQDKKAKSKVKYIIENKNQSEYKIIPFDNGVFKEIQSKTEKCDFGLVVENRVYFIELKGSDNNKALKQILETLKNTQSCFKKNEFCARVVTSNKQKPENLDKITESKIKKLTKNNLIISQNSYTEII
jgi:hypothetical protein